ncbi:hypothetical protein EsH8_IX_000326 [Colletotrichum jinshuiense]
MSSKSGKDGKVTDSRFSNFETDPRFRLPSKKKTKTTIDKRFSRMLKDDSFTATAKVDRYGRKVKSDSKKKALQRLYEEEDGEEDEEDEGVEVEADDVVERELAKLDAKYDPARGGGFSESESESESEDDDSEEETAVADPKASMQRLRDEQAEVEEGEVTNRIAIVNLDWDNIKSADLFALFTSFLPPTGGRVEKISIYPSEFGKERMQREELEGPPKEIFKKSNDDDSEEDSDESSEEEEDEAIKDELLKEGDDQDFDSDALRKYQLDRLRYYYAIMTCSDKKTAQKLYEAVDGTEYQSSSNFLDLRFVPDDVTFDDEASDECDNVPEGYKPVEFITDALQHSKVKLTWDVNPDDAARKASINRAFTGSRSQLEENDLKAYLASDSEDDGESFGGFDDEEDEEEEEEAAAEPKLSKKELARRKMREALGLGAEEEKKSKDAPVGEMEITFTPALTESKKDKKDGEEETTIEKYKRKERERKEKKREAARARREGADAGAGAKEETQPQEDGEAGDLGFDDPFFTTEEVAPAKTKTSMRKEERLAKRAAREAEEKEKAEQKAQLQLLMADENGGDAEHLDHFDMNEIVRAEKAKKKKGKGKKKAKKGGDDEKVGLQEGFAMDVGDDRFKAVFESHEYAIDPSNPKFKGTEGMQKLLEEGRKKRKAGGDDDEPVERETGKKAKKQKGDADELSGLVASVKKRAASKAGKK